MEEKLKKAKKDFTADTIMLCCFWFVGQYISVYKLIESTLYIKILMHIVVVCLVLAIMRRKEVAEKEALLLSVMPMIISIKDTTESLKSEKNLYYALCFLMFVIGYFMADTSPSPFNIVFILIGSLSFMFLQFAQFTDKKLKYLENKPEGV